MAYVREHVSAYTEIRAPRWGKEEREYQTAAPKVPYIYGTGRNNALVHKISYIRLRWWECGPSGHYLVRRQSPRLTAITHCGRWMRIDSTDAKTCAVPKPDAVLCGFCNGGGRNFPRNRPHAVPRPIAKLKLGCIAEAS